MLRSIGAPPRRRPPRSWPTPPPVPPTPPAAFATLRAAPADPRGTAARRRPVLDSGSTAPIGLNSVTFEELRSQGLSVTQATRLLAHRERLGGFSSVDDLDQVAGFPPELLADVKSRATL